VVQRYNAAERADPSALGPAFAIHLHVSESQMGRDDTLDLYMSAGPWYSEIEQALSGTSTRRSPTAMESQRLRALFDASVGENHLPARHRTDHSSE
jgi:hypothetical protein